MTSRVEIYVEFDFRGKSFRPVADIDLDAVMERYGEVPSLTQVLARENGIDLYSYELEVMETVPVQVSRADGLARQFVQQNGWFDKDGFEAAWRDEMVRQKIESITQHGLSVEEAVLAAYRLGLEDGRQEKKPQP